MTTRTGNAAVYVGAKKELQVREYPLVKPPRGQAMLSLQASGICGTDLHIVHGRLALGERDLILGHEFVGRVEEFAGAATDGTGRPLKRGDLAIACVALPCGKCFCCQQGETASCLNFGVTYFKDPQQPPHFFGGFADFLFSPTANLVKLPAGVAIDTAAAFACAGPTAIRAFDFADNLKPKELVVVQGAGPVGLFAVAWAVAAGCTVVAIASSSNPRRMEIARRLGAKAVLDYRTTTPEERAKVVMDLAAKGRRGNGADVVFEASGSPAAIPEGLSLVRTLGRYIIPGQYSDSGTVPIAPQMITFKAIRIVGSGQYKLADIQTYLKFLKKRPDLQATLGQCLTHRYRVEDANQAMIDAADGKSVKGVFVAGAEARD